MAEDSIAMDGKEVTALAFLRDVDFMMLEAKLLLSAMGIIYLGAHASLRRPPSARIAQAKKGKGEESEDEDEEDETLQQGLELSDAILFPVLAAGVLLGLYYLIQWLKDPAMLNQILRWYMSGMSVASLVTFYAHGLELGTSLAFPRYWRGADGRMRKVDQRSRTVTVCDDAGNTAPAAASAEESNSPSGGSSPLPGPLALLAASDRLRGAAWELRHLLTRHWTLRLFVRGAGEEKVRVKLAHLAAVGMSLATAALYFATSWSWLSNVLGYGMCYCSFLVLSPTDFLIGSLVLGGLFVYDVVMVFYTPYMVTVATALDVPIKLTFEAAQRRSILGLGDIVIPGILIGWALRLDLWIHYARKIKREPVELRVTEADPVSGEDVERSETRDMEVKAPYVSAKGNWGERLWMRGSTPGTAAAVVVPAEVAAGRFAKTYFYASMAGYGAGMLAALAMLLVFKRGQPALLYLVPGVLGSLVLTSLARGESDKLWAYTENGSLDVVDVVVDLDDKGKVVKTVGRGDLKKKKERLVGGEKRHRVFVLSLEALE